jgi:dihydropteroate synthase
MAGEGADVIDIGGESTRPGSHALPAADEIKRVIPVVERLRGKIAIPLSIDTRKSEVAREACRAGATIINDISALSSDEMIADVAGEYGTYLILMHMRGTPATMQLNIHYDDLIGEITDYLRGAADKAMAHGVLEENIIIDPGIGFGKTVEHNFSLLKNISVFAGLGYPVLIGASRKSFIGKTLDLPVGERLAGSLAAAIYAGLNGASIIRVHDVAQTVRAFRIIEGITKADR